jgi:predicted transposase YbfD/YdcC
LLALLDLAGCIVTADAMICQKDIARQIVDQGGDYVLALKQNQPTLHDDARRLFEHALEHRFADLPHRAVCHVEKGHGRIVTRRCIQVDLVDLDGLWHEPQQEWAGLSSLVMLQSERQMLSTGRTSVETRYYISSLAGDAGKVARAVRRHWGIENRVHWVLDVVFDEDDSRIRKDHGPQNFAVLRHMALNLLRQETSSKASIKAKQKKAGWNNDFLDKILTL